MTAQLDLGLDPGPAQLPLDLPWTPDHDRAAIVETPALRPALAIIDAWPDWHAPCTILTGPAGCGKTHLASVWASRAEGVQLSARSLARMATDRAGTRFAFIENADIVLRGERSRAVQTGLFHLINHVRGEGGNLLLTARSEPSRWHVDIPDLASRLNAATHVRLPEPDGELLRAVVEKLFSDRQMQVGPELVGYLIDRMERSLGMARHVVAGLDRMALAEGRKPDRRMADRVLATL